MNKKQKKTLERILIAVALVIVLKLLPALPMPVELALYCIPYLVVGWDVLRKALKGIKNRQPFDECFLMAVATVGAFALGDYVEGCAVIIFYQIGELFQSVAVGKSRQSIASLMDIRPDYANIEGEDGKLEQVDPDEVEVGTVIVVQPGERVPIDGVIVEGASALNTAALTGESLPRDVNAGDEVISGCVNMTGLLKVRTTKEFGESTVSKILDLVENSSMKKARAENFITRFARVYTPAVCYGALALALLPPVVLLLMGQPARFGDWVYRALTFLVISCPCALGLATPVAIMVGNGLGAKNGILFKTAAALEEAGRTRIVALDKTGTITCGEPTVTDLLPAVGVTETELLTLAAALEGRSEHPLARAVLAYAEEKQLELPSVTDFTALPGNGLTAKLESKEIFGGSAAFIGTKVAIPAALQTQSAALAAQGKTPLFFGGAGRLLGVIAVADTIKEDSPQAIRELRNMGIRVVMLTGDNQRTAEAIGRQAGVDEVIAGVLPEGKEAVIRQLQKYGKVAMVGDGINDAPALTRADTGIAIGAGTDVAIDAADVVLMNSKLSDVPAAIRLSRASLRNIHENLFWAFIYNIIGIPLAAGVFIPFGLTLNPMFGAAAMSLSSFCVVSNALRLNLFDLHSAKRDHPPKHVPALPAVLVQPAAEEDTTQKEETAMKKTLTVEGMMCPHCEARVKKALEALPQVDEAVVSHEAGTAIVTLNAEVDDEVLKKAVEAQDYPVTSIQ